ncbi:MAG: hypothetical protein KatS3mg111_0540 [Pirellulaceae bacterium]|nr:MAG: hypothetical protein KatS3mg111_0540 [Pirellulaceae bacterium]
MGQVNPAGARQIIAFLGLFLVVFVELALRGTGTALKDWHHGDDCRRPSRTRIEHRRTRTERESRRCFSNGIT